MKWDSLEKLGHAGAFYQAWELKKKKKKNSLLENFHLMKHFQGFAIFIPC